MTGSVNQNGEIQAIGGINHKIEGFFDLCRARGLQPGQGVIIPAANVAHLMLRPDVVAAVAAGSARVEQERARLAALMAELTQSVVVCNLDGRVLLYNSRARTQFRALSSAPALADEALDCCRAVRRRAARRAPLRLPRSSDGRGSR